MTEEAFFDMLYRIMLETRKNKRYEDQARFHQKIDRANDDHAAAEGNQSVHRSAAEPVATDKSSNRARRRNDCDEQHHTDQSKSEEAETDACD